MVGILREADREQVAQAAKKHGINEQTIHTWRQRFSGMNADEVKRLRQLEQENARLKKLLAERDLEIEVKKEVAAKMVSAPARRQQAASALKRGCRNARRVRCSPWPVQRFATSRAWSFVMRRSWH